MDETKENMDELKEYGILPSSPVLNKMESKTEIHKKNAIKRIYIFFLELSSYF